MSSAAGEGSQTSSSPSPPQARDYPSHLPAELLRLIFRLAYPKRGSRPSAPLSKALLPFFLERVYDVVEVRSYAALGKLCKVVAASPKLALVTEEFSALIPWAGSEVVNGETQQVEQVPPSRLHGDELIDLFRSLTRLEAFTVEGSTHLARLIFDPVIALDCFPSLVNLSLTCTFAGIADPFHPGNFSSLPLYNTLDSFRLVVRRAGSTLRPPLKPYRTPRSPIFPPMFRIVLEGPLSDGSADYFAEAFSSIGQLSLLVFSATSSLPALLSALRQHLYRLDLHAFAPAYSFGLGRSLSAFTGLTDLNVSGSATSPAPAYYDTLRALPLLRTLTIGPMSRVPASELCGLISGTRKHPALRRLVLDNVQAKMGTRIDEDADGVPAGNGYDEDWRPYDDWVLPVWPAAFSVASFRELLYKAEMAGIEVTGSALDALGVEEAYELEFEAVDAYKERTRGGPRFV
ncbi:hypothetical protein JCM10213_002830 [Rhodosporidiobolus nylandii]